MQNQLMHQNTFPLCVDLDGTLVKTDMLHESAISLLKSAPLSILKLPWILLTKGKAGLKQWIARQICLDASVLPYNQNFIMWLNEQHINGRRLILCTASDQSIAEPISSHLGIFEEVIASNGMINLEGDNKAKALVNKFGSKGFDYAGNSIADIKVWRHSRNAIVVNASDQIIANVTSSHTVSNIFERDNYNLNVWMKVLRIHQWLKNLLLFIPLLAAHRLTDSEAWFSIFFAFVAFSICASSVYITNDLLDLESDRKHPRKCKRPFASGMVPVWKGAIAAPLLFSLSLIVGIYVGDAFSLWLMIYFLITSVYSIKLKQLVIVDCMTLAILYTLRIVAGASAIYGAISFWLLAFSIFLFLSLAFIKRFAELQVQLLNGKQKAHGRGYFTDDAPLIQMLGISSGYVSVLVLALYLNSPEVLRLYSQPQWAWGVVPVMVFWISWLWLRAHRGEMHDDPLIFAVKDKVSLLAGSFFAIFMFLGAIHL